MSRSVNGLLDCGNLLLRCAAEPAAWKEGRKEGRRRSVQCCVCVCGEAGSRYVRWVRVTLTTKPIHFVGDCADAFIDKYVNYS